MNRRGTLLFIALAVALVVGIVMFRQGNPSRFAMNDHSDPKNNRPAEHTGENTSFAFEGAVSADAQKASAEQSRAHVKELEAAIEPLRGNVVVSLGKVEDIGREAGYIMPSLVEMRSLASTDPAKLSPEQRQHLLDLQRRYAGLLGMLPEIAGFQNNPAEYGKFFSNMARQSAGLSELQTSQVDGYMRARAGEMIQAGLNEAKKPADAAQMDSWEARRDQFNEQTVDGLRQLLTPSVADRAGINDQLMEFIETDFDKAGMRPGLN